MARARSKGISLSKSTIMRGLQCEKSLFLQVHQPELAAEVTDSQQMIFDQGHEIGIEAQKRFPKSLLIEAPYTNPQKAIADTKAAIEAGALALFEPAFENDGVLVRVDILHRKTVKSPWTITEVKSSTELKPEYILDATIQTWVLESSGLKVAETEVWHINSECTYPDLKNLFCKVDVTAEVKKNIANVVAAVKNFKTLLSKSKEPKKDIGPHCDDPYECPFKEYCWAESKISELSVFDIPGLQSKKKWGFYRRGIIELKQLLGEDLNLA